VSSDWGLEHCVLRYGTLKTMKKNNKYIETIFEDYLNKKIDKIKCIKLASKHYSEVTYPYECT